MGKQPWLINHCLKVSWRLAFGIPETVQIGTFTQMRWGIDHTAQFVLLCSLLSDFLGQKWTVDGSSSSYAACSAVG